MQIRTDGVVIKESDVGENDKYITILTSDLGTVEAYVKGAKRKGSKLYNSTKLFCYSTFILFQNKNKYYVNETDVNNLFYDLRLDIERLTVASYFCQIIYEIKPESDTSSVSMKLLLNSLHLLANTQKNAKLIKSVFEMRILTINGFTPDILACNGCGEYENNIRFYIGDGTILCDSCANKSDDPKLSCGYARLTRGVLAALRHIVYCVPEKVFSFTLDDENIKLLSEVCESYLICQTERNYKSLEFLKSIED